MLLNMSKIANTKLSLQQLHRFSKLSSCRLHRHILLMLTSDKFEGVRARLGWHVDISVL